MQYDYVGENNVRGVHGKKRYLKQGQSFFEKNERRGLKKAKVENGTC